MSEPLDVRRLRVEDAAALVSLRREALETDPLAFGSSIEEDRGLSLDLVRVSLLDEDERAVFGCLEGGGLVGMVGVARDAKVKRRHIGSVWGMYVTARVRSRGAGRALLDAAIQQARAWGLALLELGVMDNARAARRLYERAGFRAWGREPRALQWNGRFVDAHHLALDLGDPGQARRGL